MAEPDSGFTLANAYELYIFRFGSPVYDWYSVSMDDPHQHQEFLAELGRMFTNQDGLWCDASEMLTKLLDYYNDNDL